MHRVQEFGLFCFVFYSFSSLHILDTFYFIKRDEVLNFIARKQFKNVVSICPFHWGHTLVTQQCSITWIWNSAVCVKGILIGKMSRELKHREKENYGYIAVVCRKPSVSHQRDTLLLMFKKKYVYNQLFCSVLCHPVKFKNAFLTKWRH